MLKIKSTQTLAISNTKGACDVERTIIEYKDVYNETNGTKRGTMVVIKSKLFQEQELPDDSGVERLYIKGSDHVGTWTFTPEEIEDFKTLLASELEGKNEEEQRLIVFIAQTKAAGSDGKGWQGMDTWIPDIENYKVVDEFSLIE